MMKIYEYAILHHPLQTKEQKENGIPAKTEIVVDVTRILANSDKDANMLAARAIPERFTDCLDRVEIALRPF